MLKEGKSANRGDRSRGVLPDDFMLIKCSSRRKIERVYMYVARGPPNIMYILSVLLERCFR